MVRQHRRHEYNSLSISNIVLCFARESQNNYRGAARLYTERYPDRRHPDDRAIRRLTQRVRGGCMVRQRRRHAYDVNDNRVVTTLAIIHLDPHISARRVEKEIGASTSRISYYFDSKATVLAFPTSYCVLPVGFTNDRKWSRLF
ncbi:hypothetical protein TSAR_002885 [Trichomalopsis sarcophagae]|uniref:DUF4817 domain-containing protein n=1 Tax=Trichomalopsis sarcophagae TaxID=543379 RepID=A0A232ER12_9HYME|nr:hypothetical protein TSAR_002885 [Trichomalopsis sarcophagae]